MDRIARAEQYAERFRQMGRFRLMKRMDPHRQGEGFVIGYMDHHQGQTVYAGDLAKASGVSTARIAAALRTLEQKGLLTRSPSETDARKTVVRLTDAGMQLAQTMRMRLYSDIADVVDYVGAEEIDTFLRIAEKINDAIAHMETKGETDV